MSRALIIIDFINEFLHPDGKLTPQGMGKFCMEYGTIENARKLIDTFRESHEEVIWVHLGFHENYDNCSSISPRFKWAPSAWILKEDTWSVAFVEGVGYDPSEKTFTKTRISSFYKTGLEEYLQERGITEIVVSWVTTDLAVSSITRDAHDRDILTTVISDACATISIEHHDAALIGIAKLANVMTTAEFLGT
jgi:nicotinamidase-related amidase